MRAYACIATVLFLAGAIPAGAAPIGADVCFRVANEVGWALADVRVDAIDSGIGTHTSRLTTTTSDDEGWVVLDLPRGSVFRILLKDATPPTSPLRNGLTYLPAIRPDAGATFRVPAASAEIDGACPGGARGVAFTGAASPGTEPGTITLAGPPTQGYLELTVVDSVTVGPVPLEGARVSVPVAESSAPGFAVTDEHGIVRLACVASVQEESGSILVTKDDFHSTRTTSLCPGTAAVINERTVGLWRTAVAWEFTVLNATNAAASATGMRNFTSPPFHLDAVRVNESTPPVAPTSSPAVPPQYTPAGPTPGVEPIEVPGVDGQEVKTYLPAKGLAAQERDVSRMPPASPIQGARVAVVGRAVGLTPSGAICGAGAPPTGPAGGVDETTPHSRHEGGPSTVDGILASRVVHPFALRPDEPNPVRRGPLAGSPAYLCSVTTDAAGRGTLMLPWDESPGEGYTVAVSASGYVTEQVEKRVPAAWARGSDPDAPGALHQTQVVLEGAKLLFSERVVDIHGRPLPGVNVTFTNSTASITLTADAAGEVSTPLETGPYLVNFSETPLTRNCAIVVGQGPDGGFVETSNVTRCFTLLAPGTRGVTGYVQDALVPGHPAPGVRMCAGATAELTCDVTDELGYWAVELTTNVSWSADSGARRPRTDAGQEWTLIGNESPLRGGAGPEGALTEVGVQVARRSPVLVKVRVQDGAAVALPNADVTLARDGVAIHDAANGNNQTNANGDLVDANGHVGVRCGGGGSATVPRAACDTYWTKKLGYPSLTAPGTYIATATKHRKATAEPDGPLHALNASAAFELFAHEVGSGHTETITLDPERGDISVAVVAWDQTAGTAATAKVNATPLDAANWGHGEIAHITTPGSLRLYGDAGTYSVCVRPDEWYEVFSEHGRCWTNVTAGMVVNLTVDRATIPVTITGIDPHTGWSLVNYNTTIHGKIPCRNATAPGPACFGQRPPAGVSPFSVTVRVPWTAGADDLCIHGTAKTYLTVPPGVNALTIVGAEDAVSAQGEQAPFEVARHCQVWAPKPEGYAIQVKPLRSLNPNPLVGSVRLGTGGPAVGATVTSALPRAGFQCAPGPTDHHTPGASRTCSATISSTARYEIRVPVLAPDDAWAVSARLAGYYDETYDNWTNLTVLRGDFVLVPRDLPVTVTVVDVAPAGAISRPDAAAASRACGWQYDEVTNITVRLRDLRRTDTVDPGDAGFWAHETTATPWPDGTCRVDFVLEDWRGESDPMPAALNMPWPVTSAPYLFEASYVEGIGYAVAVISAAPGTRSVAIPLVETNLSASREGGVAVIRGRVSDADLDPVAAGRSGVPAWVTAVPENGACSVGGVTVLANITGEYRLPLGCAGNHTITAIPVAGTHWQRASGSVSAGLDAPASLDLPVARTTSDLAVRTVRSAPGSTDVLVPVHGLRVFLDGVDVNRPVPSAVSSGGVATFEQIPWGTYAISFRVPGVNQAPPKHVQPGRDEAIAVVPPA